MRLTIADMQALARRRKGKCLSSTYLGAYGRLKWRCSEGHEWETTPNEIRRESWCPKCACEARRRYDLPYMQALTRRRGGRLLSRTYSGLQSKLRFLCRLGHKWDGSPRDLIYSGSWCPKCGANRRGAAKRLGIEAMRQVAQERGGRCVSQVYSRCSDKYRWRCKEKHEWEATGRDVLYSKSWCPTCGGSLPLAIGAMRALANSVKASVYPPSTRMHIHRCCGVVKTAISGGPSQISFNRADGAQPAESRSDLTHDGVTFRQCKF